MGTSLTGLRAAERLREEGFTGSLTLIGEETHEPYDRPPLSKQVLAGSVRSDDTSLPRRRDNRRRLASGRRGHGSGSGRQAGASRRRQPDRIRQAVDRHRRAGPFLAKRGGGGAGRRADLADPGGRGNASAAPGRAPSPGPGHWRRVHRLRSRFGVPRTWPAGHRGGGWPGTARRGARQRDRCNRRRAADRERRGSALRRQGRLAGRRCRRTAAPRPPVRWHNT